SWGPWAIGDHGAPVSLPKLKKAYEKGTRGISWGPLLTPGPRALPEFPNGQSALVRPYTGQSKKTHKWLKVALLHVTVTVKVCIDMGPEGLLESCLFAQCT
ncbi:unnamed protein product, partial [Staurois parvus]